MKKIIRVLSILIITVLVMTAVSCNSNNGSANNANNADTQNTGNSGDTPEGTTQPDVNSILASQPDADYGGYEFRIWTSNKFNDTLDGRQAPDEQETGDVLNDALFRRDRLIEDKYNIQINYTIAQTGDPSSELLGKARNAIKAGDDAFDFGMDNMINFTKNLAQDGMLVDFNSMPNIDLTQDWWSKYAIRDLTIDGKFFFPTGDITARYPGSQYLILFNKKLFADSGIDYPYQTVLDGKWTLNALTSITKDSRRDLNGDGVYKKADDSFGIVVESMAPFCFLEAGGEGLIKIVDGNPTLNYTAEKTVAIMDKLSSLWSDPNLIYYPENYQTYDEVPIFKSDRALLVAMTGSNLPLFKDMESDFGILPLPKYDETQDDYYSYCQPYGSAAVCVPVTNSDLNRTGMIIEAMAAAGRYTSTPAQYDITLKQKYSRDNDSEAMLDIICAGSCYDFAFIYNWGSLYDTFVQTINKGQSFTSKFDAITPKVQAALDKTIAAYETSQ
ncbi:MAG: hypothetical protein FWD71_01630 [Oscillospiraceae bacterium]|nr:hypothetical protein [Oscillospiraceae bacterium]